MKSNTDTTIETAAQRKAKGLELLGRVGDHCRPGYQAMDKEKQLTFLKLFEDFSEAVNQYWNHETVWDSQLIAITESIPNPGGIPDPLRFKTHEISTTESVMDKARALYAFIALKGEPWKP